MVHQREFIKLLSPLLVLLEEVQGGFEWVN
jgi:hypothetical protein